VRDEKERGEARDEKKRGSGKKREETTRKTRVEELGENQETERE